MIGFNMISDALKLGGISRMKRLVGTMMALGLMLISCFGIFSFPQQAEAAVSPVVAEFRNSMDDKLATDFGKKIDLNNTNVRAFAQFPGLYPTLARMILSNAPFEEIDDIFDMPDLTDRQAEILKANLDKFTISSPDSALVEGGDRFNNGIYR
jgi:photosystem II PsbU protein